MTVHSFSTKFNTDQFW